MNTALLKDFIEPAPVCAASTSLAAALKLYEATECDSLVIVDSQHNPISLVRFRSLMPYALQATRAAASTSVSTTTGRSPASLLPSSSMLYSIDLQTLQQQSLEDGKALFEPVIILHPHWSLSQFCQSFHSTTWKHWVLVDSSGQYLGLLNPLRLWQYMAHHPMPGSTQPYAAQERVAQPVEASEWHTLLHLLEKLPLPLMIQTSHGEILYRNTVWREQVGQGTGDFYHTSSLASPGSAAQGWFWLHQSSGDRSVTALPGASASSGGEGEASAGPSVENDGASGMFNCTEGDESNVSICHNHALGEQERIWQFTRLPLNAIQPPHKPLNSVSSELNSLLERYPFWNIPSSLHHASRSDNTVSSPDGATCLWLVLAQDITDQQHVARELSAKNADLIQLNRLKDEFLACISHELKTPLTAVLGLSSLLKDQQLGPLNDRQVRYAQLIYQGGRHLVLIVNDILDLTRIETGQMELTLEQVSVEKVCLRAHMQALQAYAIEDGSEAEEPYPGRETDVPFTLTIHPTVQTLMADESRLRQMLSNLISNALKFTEPGGQCGLTVDCWDGWIAFTVWDTGIGIPADKQHLIFQKFQQLENPLTRRFEGTGLGLVLTQRLARLHGGDVTFTSTEGRGSQFTLLLPAVPACPHGLDRDALRPGPSSTRNRLVLVVEAVPRFLEELTTQLTELGYWVAIARSGTEALEKIRRLQPGAVLLNPLLPMLSGWDVLTLLKIDDETRHIPVIVTSTWADRAQAYSNRANGFLSIPIEREALKQSLEQVIAPVVVEPPPATERLKLTILHLYTELVDGAAESVGTTLKEQAIANLNVLLHPRHCRIVQVDDLEQAELLARVWKPDVILLDGHFPDPLHYLQQLVQYPVLAALPLVTLTPEITQAANQIPGLDVFPCLEPLPNLDDEDIAKLKASALWQVIQVAASAQDTSHILVADLSQLQGGDRGDRTDVRSPSDWVHSVVAGLQHEGFRSSASLSWGDLLHQMEHETAKVLVLYPHRVQPHPDLLSGLQALASLKPSQPILVWDNQGWRSPNDTMQEVHRLLEEIATRILPPSLSMAELVEQVKQTLGERHRE